MQVRDLDPVVDQRLKGAAAKKGLSYSEFLRRELTRIAERLRIEDHWNEIMAAHRERSFEPSTADRGPFERLDLGHDEIVALVREDRDAR